MRSLFLAIVVIPRYPRYTHSSLSRCIVEVYMFGLRAPELIIILVVVLIIFGPKSWGDIRMDASQIVLTAEGRQKLVEELAWREGDYAKEIVEDIKEARAFGDLSENSEYDAAKDKQAQNAARIAEIQAILANAQVAATTGDLTVSIGSTVSLIDPNGEVMEVTLVGTTETNSLEHKISNESPVGHAIIGHGEGDSVEVVTPSGKTRVYTIAKIAR